MKLKILLILTLITLSLIVGCATKENSAEDGETPGTDTEEGKDTNADGEADAEEDDPVDVVTTPSIVNNGDAFLHAVGPDAFWLVATLNDITIDQEIVVEGEYTKEDREDPSKQVPAGRKIALYAQDEDRNKTASYTLTAPKMTVKSKDTKIQGGTFIGDVYVEATGFNLVDAKVEGNVYFANEEQKNSFTMDEKSSVTGATEIKTQ